MTQAAQGAGGKTGAVPRRGGLRAFGLGLLVNMPPPGAWVAAPLAEPSLCLQAATSAEIAECWSGLDTIDQEGTEAISREGRDAIGQEGTDAISREGRDAIGWEGTIDGAPFVVERGRAGDHRFVHGELPDQRGMPAVGTRAIHHLSADAGVLRCAPVDPDEESWWRVVLDSVLFTVALLQGYEALHAGAVATPHGALAIAAATGGGKSTLLCELLSDGMTLMTDDVLVLEAQGEDSPLAHPGPPLMTVPGDAPPLPGAPIATIDEERWVAVPVQREALPLSALVVLNRSPGLTTSLHRVRDPLAVLVGSLLRFPRLPERERARFEVAGAIASHVPIWELCADPSVTSGRLADLLRAELIGSERTRHA